MCLFCGTPDPTHDLLLMRAAVLAVGTTGILAPRKRAAMAAAAWALLSATPAAQEAAVPRGGAGADNDVIS